MASGWNGSDRRGVSTPVQPKVTAKKPSLVRGLIAGLVVVSISVGVYFVFFDGSAKPDAEDGGRNRKIKEVAPAKVAKQNESAPKKQKIAHPKTVEDALANIDLIEPTPIPKAKGPVLIDPYTNRTFNTGLEQVMGWVFAVQPGKMPIPPPPMSEEDRRNITAILISKNKINENDSEEVAMCKEQVDFAKKELAKFIGDGGDPDEFLNYYYNELRRCFELKNEAAQQALELWGEDPELGEQFLEKVNEKLEEQGIEPLTKGLFG